MAEKFTKVLLAVELDGKPYGVELERDLFQLVIQRAADLSPDGELSLSPMPNKKMFEVVMCKTPAQPAGMAHQELSQRLADALRALLEWHDDVAKAAHQGLLEAGYEALDAFNSAHH